MSMASNEYDNLPERLHDLVAHFVAFFLHDGTKALCKRTNGVLINCYV